MSDAISDSDSGFREMYEQVLEILDQTSKERDELANTVIQLEAELRSKTDIINQIDACDSVVYDGEEQSIRPADSTFEDSVMMQDTCGIWFSTRAPTDQNFLLSGWSADRTKTNKKSRLDRFEFSDREPMIGTGFEMGTQTEDISQEDTESTLFGDNSRIVQIVGVDLIDNLMSEIEKIERTLDLVFVFQGAEDSRKPPDCLHTLQNKSSENSVHPAGTGCEPIISPTLKNRVDMRKLKAFFVDATCRRNDPCAIKVEKCTPPSIKLSKSSKENLPPQMAQTDDAIACQDTDFATPVKGKAVANNRHSSARGARKSPSSNTPLRGNQPKGTATCAGKWFKVPDESFCSERVIKAYKALKQAEEELLTARGNIQASRFRAPWTPPQLKVNKPDSTKRLRPSTFFSLSLRSEAADKASPCFRDSMKSPSVAFRLSPTKFVLPIRVDADCTFCGEASDKALDVPKESSNPDSCSVGSSSDFKKELSANTNP